MLTLRRLETLSSRQEYAARMDGFKGLNMRDDDSIMPLEESPKEEISFKSWGGTPLFLFVKTIYSMGKEEDIQGERVKK